MKVWWDAPGEPSQDSSRKALVLGPVCILVYTLKLQGEVDKQARFYRNVLSLQVVKVNDPPFHLFPQGHCVQAASDTVVGKQAAQ